VVANPCDEFRALEASDFRRGSQPVTVVDCWRILRPKLERCEGIRYVPLGVGSRTGKVVELSSALEHKIARANILGVGVSAIDMSAALECIEGWVSNCQPNYVCVANTHSINECYRDAEFRRIHSAAGLVTPDGMPLVWLLRWMGYRHVERVYGPDLMLAVCSRGLGPGYRHFLYGGWPSNVVERLAARLRERFPGIAIAGTHCPPFRPLTAEEDREVIAKINASHPDIVWVGLGAPKEERWVSEHLGKLTAPVLIGVGAAFDFHAGVKRQAPRWMMRAGIEWLFRLLQEPRRLGPRYLVNNPMFVLLIALQLLGIRRPALAHAEVNMPAD
jgi:N-acetylglucosaminyldiphosphoundecaprenol N-acetyl-beta-D-mannosaminyltransferase